MEPVLINDAGRRYDTLTTSSMLRFSSHFVTEHEK